VSDGSLGSNFALLTPRVSVGSSKASMWASFGASDEPVPSNEPQDDWTSFEEAPPVVDLWTQVFGALPDVGVPLTAAAPLQEWPSRWSDAGAVRPPFNVARLLPWAAPPPRNTRAHSFSLVNRKLNSAKVVWHEQQDWTVRDLWEAAVEQWGDVGGAGETVLVNASDEFVPMHRLCSTLPASCALAACNRLQYLQRRVAVLNDSVARCYRSFDHAQLDRALCSAWELYLDSCSRYGNPDQLFTVALVSEATRCGGPRFLHCSLLERGDTAGISIHRSPRYNVTMIVRERSQSFAIPNCSAGPGRAKPHIPHKNKEKEIAQTTGAHSCCAVNDD
jgi:hypothetical protein